MESKEIRPNRVFFYNWYLFVLLEYMGRDEKNPWMYLCNYPYFFSFPLFFTKKFCIMFVFWCYVMADKYCVRIFFSFLHVLVFASKYYNSLPAGYCNLKKLEDQTHLWPHFQTLFSSLQMQNRYGISAFCVRGLNPCLTVWAGDWDRTTQASSRFGRTMEIQSTS